MATKTLSKKAKRTPKRVVASFPLSYHAGGAHLYDGPAEGGEFALGVSFHAGRALLAKIAQMEIPLGTEIRVTMEPIRRRGRNSTWKKIENPAKHETTDIAIE